MYEQFYGSYFDRQAPVAMQPALGLYSIMNQARNPELKQMSRQYRKTCARLLANTISSLLKEQVAYDAKLEIRGIICLAVDDQEDEIVIKLDDTVEINTRTDNADITSSVNNGVNHPALNGNYATFHHQIAELEGPTTIPPRSRLPLGIYYAHGNNVKAFSEQQQQQKMGENSDFNNGKSHDHHQQHHRERHSSVVEICDDEDVKPQTSDSPNSYEPEIATAHSSYRLERPIFRVHNDSSDNEPVNLVSSRAITREDPFDTETCRRRRDSHVSRLSSTEEIACNVSENSTDELKTATIGKRPRNHDEDSNTSSHRLEAGTNRNSQTSDDCSSVGGGKRKDDRTSTSNNDTNRSVITGHSVTSLSRGPLMMSEETTPAATNNALLKCSICSLGFEALNSCIDHYKSMHRLYLCHICYKTFSQQASLQRHIRLHTGAKPYICNLCKASFYRLDSLHNHKVRIHLHSKFICPLCPKETFVYNDRGGLRQHLKVKHSIIKMAFCPCCNKCFPVWSEFLQHRKSCSGISSASSTNTTEANMMIANDTTTTSDKQN